MTGRPSAEFEIEPADVTLDDLRWQERYDQLELESLDRVRAVAEKWSTSLGALLGLFSALLLVKGRTDITALAPGWEEAVGGLLGAALLVAAGALYLAALAGQGWPKHVEWPGGAELRDWTRTEASKAATRLAWSRVLAFAAIVLLIGAIGLTWYGEADPPSTASVVIVPTRGSAACGLLTIRSGVLAISPRGGSPVPIEGGTRPVLRPVSRCP